MSRERGRDLREIAGGAAAWISAVASVTVFALFVLLRASFATWTVGRFVHGRGELMVDAFLLLALASFVTLLVSSFGRGRSRVVGVVISFATIVLVVMIFETNR